MRLTSPNLFTGLLMASTLLTLPYLWREARAVEWLEALPGLGGTREADVSSSEPVAAPAGPRESKQAVVRILDRQTNRVQDLTISDGAPQTYGTLGLALQRCVYDYRQNPGSDVAWLDVTDSALPDKGYSGWMFSLYPAAATMEHPRYNLTLLNCVLPEGATRLKPVTTVSGTVPGAASGDSGGGDSEMPGGGGAYNAPANAALGTNPAEPDNGAPQEGQTPAERALEGDTPAIIRRGGDDDPFYVPGIDGDAAPAAVTPSDDGQAPSPAAQDDRARLQQLMQGMDEPDMPVDVTNE